MPRPSDEVFAEAVRAAVRKIGFAATQQYTWAREFVLGETTDNLHNFPIRIKIVRRVTKREWMKFYNALSEALPLGNKPLGVPTGRFRYYEVKPMWKR